MIRVWFLSCLVVSGRVFGTGVLLQDVVRRDGSSSAEASGKTREG